MQTAVKTPSMIFNMPQRLLVPLFQRPYVWNEADQWEPLWLDLQRVAQRMLDGGGAPVTPHFLGAVVVQGQTTQIGDLVANIVIDGQQRLTTLQLLLDAIHLVAEKVGATNAAKRLLSLTRNDESFCSHPEDMFKVWPTNHDRAAFNEVMAAVSPFSYDHLQHRNSRIIQAHAYFADVVETFVREQGDSECTERVNALERTARDLLQIVVIQLDGDENAQEIFETLNGRGSILTAADLIKNFIFQRLLEEGADVERIYQSQWQEFESSFWEQQVTSGSLQHQLSSLFLNHWLNAQTDDEFSVREVFTRFKRFALHDVSESMIDLLGRIKRASIVYRQFIEASTSKLPSETRLDDFAYRMGVLEADVMRVVVLWLRDPEREAKSPIPATVLDRCYELLETWIVRRMLLRLSTKSMNKTVKELVRTLEANDRQRADEVIEHFITSQNAITSYMPDDEELRRELTSYPTYRRLLRGRLRMILEAIEDHSNGFRKGVNALAANRLPKRLLTIEHIMPQEWQTNWEQPFDGDENQRQIRVHQLGNLTLLRQALNSRVSNGPWKGANGKYEGLQRHGQLAMMADVIRDHSDAWTDADINSRTQHLIDIIFQIWPAPSGYRSSILAVVQRFGSDIGLVDLLQSGAIVTGQVLVPIPSGYEHVSATVTFEGKILYNGIEHQTPSAAGSAVRNGKSTNGWGFWAVETKDGPSLRALRAKLRRQMGPDVEDQNEDDDGDPQNEGGTSSRQELQFSFWAGFGQFVNDSDRPFAPRSPRRQNWMSIAMGTTRYHIDAVASMFSLDVNSPGAELRVDFYIADDYPLFEKLLSQKDAIEEAFGSPLTWYRAEGVRSTRIFTRMKAEISDEGQWPMYYEWLLENVVRMRDVMKRFVG